MYENERGGKAKFNNGYIQYERVIFRTTFCKRRVNAINKRMKIYLAGTPGMEQREREWQMILKKRLLSFWDIYQDQFSVPFAFKLIKQNKK